MSNISLMTILVVSIMINGCSLTIGQNESSCLKDGCDYRDAGVCDDVISIYKGRHNLENRKVLKRIYWFDEDPYIDD